MHYDPQNPLNRKASALEMKMLQQAAACILRHHLHMDQSGEALLVLRTAVETQSLIGPDQKMIGPMSYTPCLYAEVQTSYWGRNE